MADAAVFDTRFLVALFYSPSPDVTRRLKREYVRARHRLVSVVTLHEFYRLTLENKGRDVARLRNQAILRDFTPVDVDVDLAVRGAELRHGHGFSLADSIIAATAIREGCPIVSDDPHFGEIEGLKTRWIS